MTPKSQDRLIGPQPHYRRCYKCLVTKALTIAFFSHEQSRPLGFAYVCKACDKLKPRNPRPFRWVNATTEQRANKAAWQRRYAKTAIGWASRIISGYRKTDRAKDYTFDLTKDFVLSHLDSSCAYCGDVISGFDRIDNSLGHTQANVLPCCATCNLVRMDNFSVIEMKELGRAIGWIKRSRLENCMTLLRATYVD